ncbi:hypothetical protein RRG08_004301 [Elysia crispata]|uniref:Uncharacterized protein n=1 Tax=Elysia crispata TaxID=231223 RepID=A0AAE1CWN6_9GAST|nr:hypothetical protein RRG08_004301 [Elysia crispata]
MVNTLLLGRGSLSAMLRLRSGSHPSRMLNRPDVRGKDKQCEPLTPSFFTMTVTWPVRLLSFYEMRLHHSTVRPHGIQNLGYFMEYLYNDMTPNWILARPTIIVYHSSLATKSSETESADNAFLVTYTDLAYGPLS